MQVRIRKRAFSHMSLHRVLQFDFFPRTETGKRLSVHRGCAALRTAANFKCHLRNAAWLGPGMVDLLHRASYEGWTGHSVGIRQDSLE